MKDKIKCKKCIQFEKDLKSDPKLTNYKDMSICFGVENEEETHCMFWDEVFDD
jgi:hypothetical protein